MKLKTPIWTSALALICIGCGGSGSAFRGLLVFRDSGVSGANLVYRMTSNGQDGQYVSGTSASFESSMTNDGDIVTTSQSDGSVYRYHQGVATRLNTSANNFRPCVTPDGNRIAFASTRDGNEEIYVMDGTGGGETRLTNDPSADYYPAISADGSQVVFSSTRDGNEEIYLINFNGTGLTRLTNNAAADTTPAFNPDGSHVIFSSNRSGTYQLYSVDTSGNNLIQLTSSSGDKFHGSFNTGGNAIFFYEVVSGIRQIFRCSSDGSRERQITHGTVDVDKMATWVYGL